MSRCSGFSMCVCYRVTLYDALPREIEVLLCAPPCGAKAPHLWRCLAFHLPVTTSVCALANTKFFRKTSPSTFPTKHRSAHPLITTL